MDLVGSLIMFVATLAWTLMAMILHILFKNSEYLTPFDNAVFRATTLQIAFTIAALYSR